MKKAVLQTEVAKSYPFWDYRCRRGSYCTNSSGASDASSVSGFPLNRARSDAGSDTGSDVDHVTRHRTINESDNRISLLVTCKPYQRHLLLDLYNPIMNWIDPEMGILDVVESPSAGSDVSWNEVTCLFQVPSLALTAFLMEDGDTGQSEHIAEAIKYFQENPWCHHHSENIKSTKKLSVYCNNHQDYYMTSFDHPLWGYRQVHCGKEIFRFTRFATHDNWLKMRNFYETAFGQSPNIVKLDFCLFTVHDFTDYEIQFALKRLPRDFGALVLNDCVLQVKVSDISAITSKTSASMIQISGCLWQAWDVDGNRVQFIQSDRPSFADVIPQYTSSPIKSVTRTDAFYV